MRMTNQRNRVVYALWAPFYDALITRLYRRGRAQAMEALAPAAGERVLLVGVGTGADLPLLPTGVQAVGIDLSAAMLARARARLPLRGRMVELRLGDAGALPFESASFDAVVLNLIVSVVPDPAACVREALRVLRPGGRAVVFDKFLPDTKAPGIARRLVNQVATIVGTDVNRRLADMLEGQPCTVVRDEASLLGGAYRIVLLRPGEPGAARARCAPIAR